jgi:hypothetical protein
MGAPESHDLPEDILLHGIGHDPAARSDPVAVGGEAGYPAPLGAEACQRVSGLLGDHPPVVLGRQPFDGRHVVRLSLRRREAPVAPSTPEGSSARR